MMYKNFIIACMIFVFFPKNSIAMEPEIVCKDDLAFDLRLLLNHMVLCAETSKQKINHNIRTDSCKNIFENHRKELKELLEKYAENEHGVVQTELWKFYMLAHRHQDITIDDFPTEIIKIEPNKFLKYTIMKLMQRAIVHCSASGSGSDNFKTLLRGNDFALKNFFRLLIDSYTLYVPMGRAAYRMVDFSESGPVLKSNKEGLFIKYLSEEISKGYWHDTEFVKALGLMLEYFEYRFLQNSNNKKFKKDFKGLENYTPQSFALQQAAILLALHLANGFLKSFGFLPKEAENISCIKKMGFNYEQSVEKTESCEAWCSLVFKIKSSKK